MILLPYIQDAASSQTRPSAEPCTETDRNGVWNSVECENAFAADFGEVRVLVDRLLSADEARCLSGCLGYALRQTICGEDVSDPTITHLRGDDGTGTTVLEYGYDSTKSRRDDPDFDQAFSLAILYAREGSPIRRTDRAGWGTRGARGWWRASARAA